MRLPIARDGLPLVGGLGLAGLVLRVLPGPFGLVSNLALAGAGFSAFFFRDPERVTTRAPGGVVAPGDGRVMEVAEVEAPEYLGGAVRKVSIFLSVFDVHVTRSPVAGVVETRSESAGGYAMAFRPEAEGNRRTSLGIAGDPSVLLRQVAGWVARRDWDRIFFF